MTTKKTATANDLFDQFTPDILKQNDSRNTLLIKNRKELKEAISPKSAKGEQVIRKMAKKLDIRLTAKDVKEVIEEVDAMAWDYEQTPIATAIRYAVSDDKQSVMIDMDNGYVAELAANRVEILDTMPANNDDVYFARPSFQQPMVKPDLTKDEFMDGIK